MLRQQKLVKNTISSSFQRIKNKSAPATSSLSNGAKWSSFIVSVNKNDPILSKLKEFTNYSPIGSQKKVTFEEWKKMFHLCKEKYPNAVNKIMDSPAHVAIFKQLFNRAFLLESGYFIKKTGEDNVILIGNSGIGRSTTYKNFVQSCQVFHPKVIPVYLTYENICGNDVLKSTLPIELIFNELEREHLLRRGNSKMNHIGKMLELSNLLESNDKYLMLIIDNIEMIFKTETKDFPKADQHLTWISSLAGDSSGRISLT